MSKCEINLRFDRADRAYLPGEAVDGQVDVRADRLVRCNGLVVEHFWRTHGKGNTTSGVVQSQNLYQGQLQAGESLSIPFSFVTPNGPPTYHGRMLNVDHYIRARVDIPWAFDPVMESEYILLPDGSDYSEILVLEGETESQAGGLLRMFGSGCGAAFLVVSFLAPFPVGLLTFPLGILVLFLSLRKWMAEWRIGKVELAAPIRTASPGDPLQIELTFLPRKAGSVRSAKAKLMCIEEVVSGSGTNETTHRHTVLEHVEDLGIEEHEVRPDVPLRVQTTLVVPETNAYSFRAPDNRIKWMLEVHIDIPHWPDWQETVPLVIRPAARRVVDAIVNHSQPGPTPASPPPELVDLTPDSAASIGVVEGMSMLGGEELSYALDRVLQQPQWSGQRGDKARQLRGHAFELALDVDFVEATGGNAHDSRYRDGRTVYGLLHGTPHRLAVQLLPVHNAQTDREGAFSLQLVAAPLSWIEPEERLLLREARDA